MKRTTWLALGVLLPFAGVLGLHAGHYLPFLSDDALISLRYARRLLDGQGLTWTAGQRVEGYSNLLWILLVAGLGRLGVDLVVAARVLGLLGMIAIMFSLSAWYIRYPMRRAVWFPLGMALMFLALAAPIAVWAIGGLEQPLYGALIAASIPLAYKVLDRERPDYRTTLRLSVVLGLLCLTRPDGPLFAAAGACALLAAGWIDGRPRPLSHALTALVYPIVFSIGQLAFRAGYYGEFIPNTARVKISPSAEHWTSGVNYLFDGLRALSPFPVLGAVALAGMLMFRPSRGRSIYLSVLAAAWSAYVVFIGGDIFPAFRHLVPLVVIVAFALADGAFLLTERLASRPAFLAPIVVLGLLAFVPYTQTQFADKWSQRAMRERWEWQGQAVGLLLKQAFSAEQPLVAVTAAGCIPYWSELPALDMMGLNDYYLPRHPPPNFGAGTVGHELGDGGYVLGRRPDIIVFDVGSRQPSWRSGEELDRIAEFHERYVPVAIRTRPVEYSAVIFVDKYSSRIGINRPQSALAVPGFLITGEHTVASINAAGRLVATLPGGGEARVTMDADPARRWVVDQTKPPPAGVDVELRHDGRVLSITLRSTRADAVDVEQIVLSAGERSEPARERRGG